MKQAPEHLVNLIEPIVEGLGYECVGVDYNPHPKNGLLRVYIDAELGILIEDCSKVSQQISAMLDVEDPIPDNYSLEVSSPGMDRPFFKLSQFEQYLGSTVTVNLYAPVDGRKRITGDIIQVADSLITLKEGEKIYQVAFAAMSKARLVPKITIGKGGQGGE